MATSTGSVRPMNGADGRGFYGWYIIAACILGICFGFVGVTIYAFSAFVLPLTDEFGWSRGAISFGMTESPASLAPGDGSSAPARLPRVSSEVN